MKKLKEVDLVWGTQDENEKVFNYMEMLNEVIEEFQVEIIGFIPMSSSGAFPEIKFLGEEESIKRLCIHYHGDESDGMEYYDEFAYDSGHTELTIHLDDRWSNGERKYISKGGEFIFQ